MMPILSFVINLSEYTFDIKDYVLTASLILNVVLGYLVYRRYYYNHTAFVKLLIKRHKIDLPEFQIKITNTGVIPVEIEAPIVVFKRQKNKRLFQVRTGNVVFPLALFKKEEYDFFIDLARFYTSDSSLITYTRVYLEIRDKNQKKLARKRIRIK